MRAASTPLESSTGCSSSCNSMGSSNLGLVLPRRMLGASHTHKHSTQRLDVQCNSASRKRRTQASAVQHSSSSADRLAGLLIRGAPVQPSIAGEDFPLRLDVADTVEQLERSLQATPAFAEPITKRKRGRKPKSVTTPARQGCSLFEAPSRGRLSTIKSTKVECVASKIAASGDSSVARRGRPKKKEVEGAAPVAAKARAKKAVKAKEQQQELVAPGTQFEMDAEVVRAIGTRLHEHRSEIKTTMASTPDATSLFLRHIANTTVLSRTDECALARMVQHGIAARNAAAELETSLGRAAADDEIVTHIGLPDTVQLDTITALSEQARELLLQHNLRLVVSVSKRYLGRGVELSDMVPEAINGLHKAIDKFDPHKGFKFSTYAHWWIRQSIVRSVNEYSRIVRLPVHVCDLINRINRVAQDLNGQANRNAPATPEEIAAVLGLPAVKVETYLSMSRPARSLEAPAFSSGIPKEGDYDLLLDTIATTTGPEEHEYESAVHQLMREDINALLSTLPPRERNVIRMRYGLHGGGEGGSMTFKDIGNAYGLSTERVRQIEDKALSKLRRPWRQKLLRPHLYTPNTE